MRSLTDRIGRPLAVCAGMMMGIAGLGASPDRGGVTVAPDYFNIDSTEYRPAQL